MTLKSGKVYSDIGAPNNTYGVDGDIYMQLDGLKTTYRKEGAVWVAVGSSLGAIPEFISGSGVPSGLLGADNQYYRNVENQDIYYKSGGLWSAIGNLQGLAFQASLIQYGIGKDLNTPPNLLNSGSLNSYITAGEFYFTSAVANRPFISGLMKVWRKNSTYVYQLVQGAGNTGLATRYSGDGGATWESWRYPANRDGDNSRTFKVANAVASDDAVALGQVSSLIKNTFPIAINYTSLSTGDTVTIPVNGVVKFALIGGGGGSAGYETGNGANGTDSFITLTGVGEICRAKGGLGSLAGYGVGSGSGTQPSRGRNTNLFTLGTLEGLCVVINNNDPEITYLANTFGVSGGRDTSYDGVPNVVAAGEAGYGAVLEVIIQNKTAYDLVIQVTRGTGGAKSGGNAQNGAVGFVGIIT